MNGARKNFLSAVLLRGWPYLLAAVLVLTLGITAGALSVERLDDKQSEEVSSYLQGFIGDLNDFSPDSRRVARNSLLNGAVMVGAIYILGLTVIGMPVTLAILFARGFVLGFAVGFLVRDLAAGGILMALVSVVPHNLLYIPALLVGVASSLYFGVLLLKRNFDSRVPVLPNYIMYTTIMLVVLAVTLGAGMVESFVSPWLIKMAAEALQGGIAIPPGG
jgi:stage II sporulation protein M